jgi:hypothetical protein
MKLDELFNNYPKQYFNVLPPKETKPTGSMIATIARSIADDQGSEPTEYESEARASKTWPNHKYDRRQNDEVAKDIVRKRRKSLKKNRNADWEYELISDKNRHARDDGTGGVFR